jgi:hypothetical protein
MFVKKSFNMSWSMYYSLSSSTASAILVSQAIVAMKAIEITTSLRGSKVSVFYQFMF